MKLERSQKSNPRLMNIIPLVDIVFLLLIFFVMGSVFVLQPGIAVSPPSSPFTLGPVRNPQVVSITSAPVSNIYFQNTQLSLEEFDKRLQTVQLKDRSIIIKADQQTPYNLIIQVSTKCLSRGYSVVLATRQEAQ